MASLLIELHRHGAHSDTSNWRSVENVSELGFRSNAELSVGAPAALPYEAETATFVDVSAVTSKRPPCRHPSRCTVVCLLQELKRSGHGEKGRVSSYSEVLSLIHEWRLRVDELDGLLNDLAESLEVERT
jgi:hypothetical protein